MDSIIIFIVGFGAAFLGTTPPGLLNLTAAKTQSIYGPQKARLFMLGSSTVSAIYCYVAASFTSFLSTHQEILYHLLIIGLLIFSALTILFLIKGIRLNKHGAKAVNYDRNNFFLTGILLSTLNILPFPFYMGITYTLQHLANFDYSLQQILLLIISVFAGTYAILYTYTKGSEKLKEKWSKEQKPPSKFNSNFVMALVMGIIVIITAFKIYYFNK